MAGGQAGEHAQKHAGIEDYTLNLIVFDNAEQLREIATAIGLTIRPDGKILDKTGTIRKCSSCEKEIEINDVGYIMPGSYYIYCKDPTCLFDYLARFG